MREESPRHSGLPQTAQDVLTWSEHNRWFELADKSICLGEGPKSRSGSGAAEERVGEEDLETEWIFWMCRRGICLMTVAGRRSREGLTCWAFRSWCGSEGLSLASHFAEQGV